MAVPGGLSNPSLTPVPFPAGSILQVVQLSGIYPDSKTFPDKPTVYNASVTNEAFEALPENATVGDIENFVETYFVSDGVEGTSVYDDPELITLSLLFPQLQRGEGLEISPAEIQNFTETPAILDNVEDPLYNGFVSIVNGYWTLLVR
jgi:alpha,alpha-trehalase